MTTIAFIFARGGSKGLPGKNVRPLGGKPLIAWSITQAKSIERIDRVVVSTDSQEIADISHKYGAEVPFLRPKELAEDDTPEWMAWRHALNYLSENEGMVPEVMLSIPATSPLRKSIDIERCLDEYEKSRGLVDVVITVTEPHRNPYFNMVIEKDDGTVDVVIKPKTPLFRRQDAPKVFDMTTVAYVLRPSFVMEYQSIFEGKVRAVRIPSERCIDIDTIEDFRLAQFLFRAN